MNVQERKQRFEAGEVQISEAIVDALLIAHPKELTTSEVLDALGLPDLPSPRNAERRICEGVLTRLAERGFVEQRPGSGLEPDAWRYVS